MIGLRAVVTALLALVLGLTLSACLSGNPPPSCDPGAEPPPEYAATGEAPDRCDPPPPPEPCADCPGIHGDPHLVTFDDRRYDLQAAGEFTATIAGDLEVQVRMEPYGQRVSVLTAVAMDVDGSRFTVTLDEDLGYVARRDSEPVELTDDFSVLVGDGRVALTGPNEIAVEWGDGSQVVIAVHARSLTVVVDLSEERRAVVDGLLGTANGDPSDDVRTRDGETFADSPGYDELYGRVAEGWRVTHGSTLFDYAEGESTETFTDRSFPGRLLTLADLSDEAKAEAEAVCRAAGVTDPGILEECILDVAVSGDASFADSAADMQRRRDRDGGSAGIGSEGKSGPIRAGEPVQWVTELSGLATVEPGEVLDGAGHVLVHARDPESRQGVLVALDLDNGGEAWRVVGVDTRCPAVPIGDGRIAVVGEARGPLADVDEAGNSLVILDGADGSLRGEPGLPDTGDGEIRFEPCRYSAHAVGDIAVYTNGRTVWGWDVSGDTPALAWSHQRRIRGTSEVAVAGERVVWATIDDDRDGVVAVLLDPSSGEVLDELDIPGRQIDDSRAAIVGGGPGSDTVVLKTRAHPEDDDVVTTLVGLGVDGDALTLSWTTEGRADVDDDADDVRSLTFGDGVVIGHADSALYAFDLDDGSRRWTYDPPGFRNTAAPGVVDDAGTYYDGIFGGPFLIAVGPDGVPAGEYDHDALFGSDSGVSSAATFGPVVGDAVIVGTTGDENRPVIVALSTMQ